jgi:hypothetical protein
MPSIMNALIQAARKASPYLAVELLLPGGSVIALLLWLFRHRFKQGSHGWRQRLASRFRARRDPHALAVPIPE